HLLAADDRALCRHAEQERVVALGVAPLGVPARHVLRLLLVLLLPLGLGLLPRGEVDLVLFEVERLLLVGLAHLLLLRGPALLARLGGLLVVAVEGLLLLVPLQAPLLALGGHVPHAA